MRRHASLARRLGIGKSREGGNVLLAHLRYGLRTFAKQPFFLAAAVLTLAVGIGATTALFSVVDAVLLKPLPYGEPEKLVSVFETRDRGVTLDGPGPANVLDWRRTTETLSGIAAWWVESTTFLDDGVGPTEEVPSAYVTVDFFSVLAVPPLLGRTFTASEVALDEPLAVLSYELWQRRYAALPSAIGRDVRFKDGTYRIIVVMPRGFRPPGTFPGEVLLFKPWDFERGYANLPEVPRDHRFLRAAARLAEDASLEEASAELDLIAEDLARAYPDKNHGWGVALVPMREALGKDARAALLVLLGPCCSCCSSPVPTSLAFFSYELRDETVRWRCGSRSGRPASGSPASSWSRASSFRVWEARSVSSSRGR
jgi:putative ABC transport system permease protein